MVQPLSNVSGFVPKSGEVNASEALDQPLVPDQPQEVGAPVEGLRGTLSPADNPLQSVPQGNAPAAESPTTSATPAAVETSSTVPGATTTNGPDGGAPVQIEIPDFSFLDGLSQGTDGGPQVDDTELAFAPEVPPTTEPVSAPDVPEVDGYVPFLDRIIRGDLPPVKQASPEVLKAIAPTSEKARVVSSEGSKAPVTEPQYGATPGEIPESYYNAIRSAESGGNDRAKNTRSSASGRYQFITSTWNGLAQRHPELGLTPEGRFDPAQQEKAIRAFTQENAESLSKAGIAITGGTLYAAHFLGDADAKRVLKKSDDTQMSSIVSRAVMKANPHLRGMDVAGFKRWVNRKAGADVIDFTRNGQGTGKSASASSDIYSLIPGKDDRGEDQIAKFREWNSDPVANEEANLKSVDTGLANVVRRAKELLPGGFVVGSGKRSAELQKKAVEWGWSKTDDSDHLHGGAIDLWPLDEKGRVIFDEKRQAAIVKAMEQAAKEQGVELDIGANWKGFKDRPHFGIKVPVG